jgi:hypothetical protein
MQRSEKNNETPMKQEKKITTDQLKAILVNNNINMYKAKDSFTSTLKNYMDFSDELLNVIVGCENIITKQAAEIKEKDKEIATLKTESTEVKK